MLICAAVMLTACASPHGMTAFLLRILAVLLGKTVKCHIVAVKVGSHGHVGVAGKKFQVDLLVNHCLRFGMKVKSDSGRHFASVVLFSCFQKLLLKMFGLFRLFESLGDEILCSDSHWKSRNKVFQRFLGLS